MNKTKINWQYCTSLNEVNQAILYGDYDFDGLSDARQIISITYNENHQKYIVIWQEDVE